MNKRVNLKKFGEVVAEAIERNGCKSHREFERLTGIAHGTIRRWVLGIATMLPDYQTLARLAPYTDYSVEELQAIALGKEDELEPVREVVTALDVWDTVSQLCPKEQAKLINMLIAAIAKEL